MQAAYFTRKSESFNRTIVGGFPHFFRVKNFWGVIPNKQTHVRVDFGDFYSSKVRPTIYIPLVSGILYCDGRCGLVNTRGNSTRVSSLRSITSRSTAEHLMLVFLLSMVVSDNIVARPLMPSSSMSPSEQKEVLEP